VLGLIYQGKFDRAEKMILSENDPDLKSFYQVAASIYKANRSFATMNSTEESQLLQLAKNYNRAGYYSQQILSVIKEYKFDHAPLQFEKQDETIADSAEKAVTLEEFEQNVDMNIYPNPTSDEFTIEISTVNQVDNGQFNLRIIDMNGKTVYSQDITTEIKNIKLRKSDLGSAGTYQCILSNNDNEQIVKKILIVE
jgi:hypothetical protein